VDHRTGALDITHIQDGVGVARAQAQALIGSIIHLHVASATRGAHEEPSLLRTQHFGPDEVIVNGLLAGVSGADLQRQALAGGASERGQAFDSTPCLEGKIGAVQLGQRLLDEGHPQLLSLCLREEEEASLITGQHVVDQHRRPGAILA
jgi:hypothetical protein